MNSTSRAKAIVTNLKQGFRGALFLRIRPENIHATWGHLILLAALNIVVVLIADVARDGLKGHLSLYGLPGILFTVPVVLLASWAVATRAKHPEQVLPFAIALSTIGLAIGSASEVVHWTIRHEPALSGLAWASYHLESAWFALASGVAAARWFGGTRLQKSLAFVLAGALVAVPLSQVYTAKALWFPPYDEKEYAEQESKRQLLENEDVFYLQPTLLNRELATLAPSRKNGADLYFVGMAGYADQDVFMKEVHYVSTLFKERYGTEHHSVELINNPQTVADFPIASVTSLQLTLKRIGEVMNPDKDILFLYLSSHGSKDHHFSLDFGDTHFNVLNPFRLRELLDESGIKRRVIVISACYSGGFIDALKDDNSLVITSAAPDKTSFGCSNDADFTYFGEAYFQDALHKTDSFVDAFNLAKPAITERENKEHFDNSDPRMYVGTNIQAALAVLTRQGPSAPAVTASLKQAPAASEHTGEFASWQNQALRGEARAQFELGWMYQSGRGVKQDHAAAAAWYQKAAAQGNAKAMANLGWEYLAGKGVQQDNAKALYLFRQSEALGEPAAMNGLGNIYMSGQGVPKDETKAFEYFRKSAMRGNAWGQNRLGGLYQSGRGVKQDDAKALEWYGKAAAQGSAGGYNEMGYLLLERRQRIPEAVAYIEKANQLAPNNPAIMDSLGWGYYLSGKTAEATKLLRQAYAGHPDPVVAAHLGEVLWTTGQKTEGEKIWREGLKQDPQNEPLKATVKKFIP